MSKSKRELREQRREAERAAVAAESRRRRIRNLLGAAGLAVVLVVGGIAISAAGGAKAKPVAQSSAAKLVATPLRAEVDGGGPKVYTSVRLWSDAVGPDPAVPFDHDGPGGPAGSEPATGGRDQRC